MSNDVDKADQSDLYDDYLAWYDEDCESVDTAEAMRLEAEALISMVDAYYTVPDALRMGLIVEFLTLLLPVDHDERDTVLDEIIDLILDPVIKRGLTAKETETLKAMIRRD